MVKLATAREGRLYGPRLFRNRFEYMNAGLYIFASIVLLCGFAAQFSLEPVSGLVLMVIAFVIMIIVNFHDLFAHLAGIDFRVGLMQYDAQLAFVEFAVPIVQALGTVCYLLGILFLLLQEEKGYGFLKFEKHAMNLLVAGPALWLLGSIHNSCQIYERADGHVQILQQSVHLPLLMGSLIFLTAAIINMTEQTKYDHHGRYLLGQLWIWMGMFGSLMFVVGGMTNVVKVFKMQQMANGMRLEKLRGGAQDRLIQEREGLYVPFAREDLPIRRKKTSTTPQNEEEARLMTIPPSNVGTTPGPTPYKDVLVGQS
ncbi:hypothetical protein LIER_14030 [Lithospermum erythrorhizon]|uniref:Uncharacterized protein n=1 Tax=Lithospermum erythrorhizon TaxID=34254 RepID=A0AAV3PZV7_LITER